MDDELVGDIEAVGDEGEDDADVVAVDDGGVVDGDGELEELQPARIATRHKTALTVAPTAPVVVRTLAPPSSQASSTRCVGSLVPRAYAMTSIFRQQPDIHGV